ncbi:MAG: hypothetical protein ACI9DF_001716, partial [Verrucomicrobiales bacterium]
MSGHYLTLGIRTPIQAMNRRTNMISRDSTFLLRVFPP